MAFGTLQNAVFGDEQNKYIILREKVVLSMHKNILKVYRTAAQKTRYGP